MQNWGQASQKWNTFILCSSRKNLHAKFGVIFELCLKNPVYKTIIIDFMKMGEHIEHNIHIVYISERCVDNTICISSLSFLFNISYHFQANDKYRFLGHNSKARRALVELVLPNLACSFSYRLKTYRSSIRHIYVYIYVCIYVFSYRISEANFRIKHLLF